MAMGEAHESEANLDQALQDYGAVLQLDPNRPNVHFRVDVCCWRVGRRREAAQT